MKHGKIGILAIAIIIFLPGTASTGEGGFDIESYGFWMGNFSWRYVSGSPEGPGNDFVLWEERYRTDITIWPDDFDAMGRLKFDVLHDGVDGELLFDLREGYADFFTDDYDFRIGRQVATWGVGDLLFINDFFPKDWVSFFGGRPLEYLKIGVDGLRILYSSSEYSWELYLIPFFEPDNLPSSDRFYFFDPFKDVASRVETRPVTSLDNLEMGLRVFGRVEGFDVAAYAYRGFWRTPGMVPDDIMEPDHLTVFYPGLATYGFSAQGPAWEGILSLEAGYYYSRDDASGDNPSIPNSQLRFLTGYERQLDDDTRLGIQYYIEIMENHGSYSGSLPAGFPAHGQYRDVVTVRLDQWHNYRTENTAVFAFYSPRDEDYLIQPQVTYKFRDDVSATLGANIFGGESGTSFLGQFDKNDNIFLSVRYDF